MGAWVMTAMTKNLTLYAGLRDWVSVTLETLTPFGAAGYEALSRVLIEHTPGNHHTYLSLALDLMARTPEFQHLLRIAERSRPVKSTLLGGRWPTTRVGYTCMASQAYMLAF